MSHTRSNNGEDKNEECILAKNFLMNNYHQYQKCQVESYPKTWGFSSKDKTVKCVQFNAMLFKFVTSCESIEKETKLHQEEKVSPKM